MPQIDNGHWQFGGEQLDIFKHAGFVYVVVHKPTMKMYFGRKNFLMGGANKGYESKWREYLTSSSRVKALIEREGNDKFLFIALEQYKTLAGLGYAETWTMMYAKTPENPSRFFNLSVEAVRWSSKEKITDRHIQRLNTVLGIK